MMIRFRKVMTGTVIYVLAVLTLTFGITEFWKETGNPVLGSRIIGDAKSVEVKKHNYLIFVEVDDNMLYLMDNGVCVKKYPISSGSPKTPSPIGTWKIVGKDTWGEGFGGRWMAFNVPWGKYGIHGTIYPWSIGNDMSHGCIRMYNEDVRELYKIIPHGTTVVIVNGSFGPFGDRMRSIKTGARGADVMVVQKRLKELGYFKGYCSGIYGKDLEYALAKLRKAKGYKGGTTITLRDLREMGFREFE